MSLGNRADHIIRKLFGGPGQPNPTDKNGGIHAATVDGQQGTNFNPSQYDNPTVRARKPHHL